MSLLYKQVPGRHRNKTVIDQANALMAQDETAVQKHLDKWMNE